MRKTKQLKMAYDIQDLTFAALKSFEESRTKEGKLKLGQGDGKTLQALVNAFVSAQERVRICRNKPLPGSLRPEKKVKPRKLAELIALDPLDDAHEQVQEQSAPAQQDQPNQAQG